MNAIYRLTFAFIVSVIFLTPVFAAETTALPCPVFGPGRHIGELAHPALTEASGMAASRLRDDLLWVVNDGHNGPYLFAVGPTGNHLGRIKLKNAPNVDWEDLASFRWKDTAYLLVADFGDNRAVRRSCILYVLAEPNIIDLKPADVRFVEWKWRLKFYYADGPRDSEAVAVDPHRQKILIIAKRKWPPQLYELPLLPQPGKGVHVAQRLTTIDHIPEPTDEDIRNDPRFGRFYSQPTAMDLSPNRRWAVVLTYKNAYLYPIVTQADWKTVFRQVPQTIMLPRLKQAEALSFGTDDAALFVTSEQRPAPLWQLRRNPECP